MNQASIWTQVCSWTLFFSTVLSVYPCINLSILMSEALTVSLDIYCINFPTFLFFKTALCVLGSAFLYKF